MQKIGKFQKKKTNIYKQKFYTKEKKIKHDTDSLIRLSSKKKMF